MEFKLYSTEVLICSEYNEPLIKVWSKPNTKINSDDKTTTTTTTIIIIIIIIIIIWEGLQCET